MKTQPPKIAQSLLVRFLRDDLAEEVQGDLEEKFYETLKNRSLVRAKVNYWYQVLNYVRPFAIRKPTSKNSNSIMMLHHNLILTFRNFMKYRSQFLINLTGLCTGLACVLFIYLWVADEISMDRYHKKNDRLYQVMSNHTDASGITTWKGVPGLLLDEIEQTVPEVESVVAMTDAHEYTLSVDESYFKVNGKFASEGFFDVFSFPLVKGSERSALSNKDGIVVTESLAETLFGNTDPVGKNIDWHFWGKTKTVQVTGVMKNLPPNTSEKFDFIMSWDFFHDDLITYKTWYNYYARIVVVLTPDSDKDVAGIKIDSILKAKQEGERVDLFLAGFSDRYLYSKYENGVQAGGRIEYVQLFSVVAIFILSIACINFINLSTAKASHRVKEIGVKKSLGATRRSLMSQYFTESVLLGLLSLFVAFLFVWMLLPQFNFITQKQLVLTFNSQLIFAAVALIVMVGIVAGSYPALYLSGLRAMEVLKGKLSAKAGGVWSRKSLVVVQFTLSVVLILAVIVVYRQVEFVKNKNLGLDRNNLIYFEREGKLIDNCDAFIDVLKTTPGVKDAVVSGYMVGGGNSTGGVDWEGKTPEDQVQFWEIRSGYGLVEIMGIKLLQGRTFSDQFSGDSTGVIFNETAIAAMGLKDPIGKTIKHYSGEKKILGVVKDFNLLSLHTRVEPMLFLYEPKGTHFIMAKLERTDQEVIERIGSLYKSFNPGYVFKPQFIDEDYQALYASEERVSLLSRYFAGFAILISCLGLFGLVTFTAEQRIKEIGVRKVLGASVVQVVMLLSKDFLKLVAISILISTPLAYYLMTKWLQNFAYRIEIEWWVFVIAGAASLLIALLTVSYRAIKAASMNPVNNLRSE